MRIWAIIVTASLLAPTFAGEPVFRIDAIVSIATIQEVVNQVRKIDKYPILSITQGKKEKPAKEDKQLDFLPFESYDLDSLEVETGVINGPLNGGGNYYYFRRVKGRWFLTLSKSWVS